MNSRWALAFVITAGFIVAEYVPGALSTLYSESLGPFAASCWLGFALQRLWRNAPGELSRLSTSALWLIVSFLGMLLLLGGFRLLWVDPWLFGVAIAPLWHAVMLLRTRTGHRPGRLETR